MTAGGVSTWQTIEHANTGFRDTESQFDWTDWNPGENFRSAIPFHISSVVRLFCRSNFCTTKLLYVNFVVDDSGGGLCWYVASAETRLPPRCYMSDIGFRGPAEAHPMQVRMPKIPASGRFAGFGGRRPLAVLHHLFVQPADAVAAGANEQEGKQGMYETGDASGQHGGGEARCLSQVLRIGLSNFLQMIGQSIHPISILPII